MKRELHIHFRKVTQEAINEFQSSITMPEKIHILSRVHDVAVSTSHHISLVHHS